MTNTKDHAAGFMLEIMADHEVCATGCAVCPLFGPLTPDLIASIRTQMGATRRPPKALVTPISENCRGCGDRLLWSPKPSRRVWCGPICKQRAYRMKRRAS